MSEVEYPTVFETADREALRGQRTFLTLLQVRLVALAIAAMGGAITVEVSFADSDLDAMGALAFASLLVALGTTVFAASTKPEQAWYDGRAIAESAKTLSWRFAVGGHPFGSGVPAQESEQLLLTELRGLFSSVPSRSSGPNSGELQITAWMRMQREEPLANRRRVYLVERIEEQQRWYSARALSAGRKATALVAAAVVLELSGIVFAVAKTVGLGVDLIGIVTAVAAGITAWSQANQFRTLSAAYSVAAQELAAIRSLSVESYDEGEWAQFVADAEEAISREHTLWRASRTAA